MKLATNSPQPINNSNNQTTTQKHNNSTKFLKTPLDLQESRSRKRETDYGGSPPPIPPKRNDQGFVLVSKFLKNFFQNQVFPKTHFTEFVETVYRNFVRFGAPSPLRFGNHSGTIRHP